MYEYFSKQTKFCKFRPLCTQQISNEFWRKNKRLREQLMKCWELDFFSDFFVQKNREKNPKKNPEKNPEKKSKEKSKKKSGFFFRFF